MSEYLVWMSDRTSIPPYDYNDMRVVINGSVERLGVPVVRAIPEQGWTSVSKGRLKPHHSTQVRLI
jgi:hypothetical protein